MHVRKCLSSISLFQTPAQPCRLIYSFPRNFASVTSHVLFLYTMLTESFVASISRISKTNTQVPKDAGIFVQELQPLQAQRHVFKKSQTAPNCLAVSETHVFAAQAGKAVVHVYNREKGNHEATVPFQERIGCLALACRGTVLVMGTEGGSIILWEVCATVRPECATIILTVI